MTFTGDKDDFATWLLNNNRETRRRLRAPRDSHTRIQGSLPRRSRMGALPYGIAQAKDEERRVMSVHTALLRRGRRRHFLATENATGAKVLIRERDGQVYHLEDS